MFKHAQMFAHTRNNKICILCAGWQRRGNLAPTARRVMAKIDRAQCCVWKNRCLHYVAQHENNPSKSNSIWNCYNDARPSTRRWRRWRRLHWRLRWRLRRRIKKAAIFCKLTRCKIDSTKSRRSHAWNLAHNNVRCRCTGHCTTLRLH